MDLQKAKELAKRCVHCGFCLEVCPTYVVTRSEVHSPRGRIAAVSLGFDSVGIDTCVFCRRCEEACPSGVEFGKLMSFTRKPNLLELSVHRALENPKELYHTLLLAKRFSFLPWSKRIAEFVPEPQEPFEYEDEGASLNLFAGCLAPVLFQSSVKNALQFLKAKHKVRLINGCCGLAHYSEGERERAYLLAKELEKRSQGGVVVSLPSNCSAFIKGYGEFGLSVHCYDFCEYLVSFDLPKVELTLTVHDPCHSKIAGLSVYTREVLRKMGVQIVEMDDPSFECGAGGGYFVKQTELSDAILSEKTKKLQATGCETVVSNNFACSLALRRAGFKTLHVADLLR